MAYVYETTDLLMSAQERADDIPLLIAHLRRMGVPALLDKHLSQGLLWGGMSAGLVTTLWLAHILSQGEGKLRHVQPWVATHPETLRAAIGYEVSPAEVHDTRLRELLVLLSNDALWYDFEIELNRHLLKNYEVDVEQIAVQCMDGWAWFVMPDGILQVNQVRGWRPGALKLSVQHTALEPLGLPLATVTESSRSASAAMLAALINHTQATLDRPGVFFVGDHLRHIEARAAVQAADGIYICRLPMEELAVADQAWIGSATQPRRHEIDGVAESFEAHEWHERVILHDNAASWEERRVLIRTHTQTETAEHGLRTRLAHACTALAALNERKRGKRRPRTLPALRLAVQEILESYQVSGLLSLVYDEAVEERLVRRYRGRPTAVRVEREVQVSAQVNEAAVLEAVTHLAWELYATNLPREAITFSSLLQGVTAASPSYERLTGRPISLTPGVLQRDEHGTGLVRLLSLGLRALVLLETAVYRRLAAEEGEDMLGGERRRVALLAGERLLEAFREIVVLSGRGARKVAVTPLTPLQRRVLYLLKLPPETY